MSYPRQRHERRLTTNYTNAHEPFVSRILLSSCLCAVPKELLFVVKFFLVRGHAWA